MIVISSLCLFVQLVVFSPWLFILSCFVLSGESHWSLFSAYLIVVCCDFASEFFSSFLPNFCYSPIMGKRVEACLVTKDQMWPWVNMTTGDQQQPQQQQLIFTVSIDDYGERQLCMPLVTVAHVPCQRHAIIKKKKRQTVQFLESQTGRGVY